MRKKIVDYFKADGLEATVKYIDPSYMIRYVSTRYITSHPHLCYITPK